MSHIIKNFIHRVGYHCESSSMRDLFEFHGFPMSEAMAFGLDGSMGFGFFEQSERMKDFVEPFFIGGKQDTINPNSLACRVLGLTLRKQSFSSADKAWQESKILLDKDIPLILQVDIGYLPFQGFEEEVHFGGHAITLAGYDDEQEIAYIGDTEFEGLQEILIKDLKQARSSEKGSPWMYPKNAQYSMTPRPDGKRPPLAAGVKLSIQKVCNHMLRPSMNYHGVQGLKRFAHSILKWDEVLKGIFNNPYTNKEQSLARTMFELTYGYLETWGTGGAAFRKLYKEFMVELITHPELKEGPRAWNNEEFKILEDCFPIIDDSVHYWTLIAETLKNAADEHQDECLNHVDLGELHDFVLYILSREEELFKKLAKIKI